MRFTPCFRSFRINLPIAFAVAALLPMPSPAWGEPLTFRRAIELAVAREASLGVAAASQVRARAAYDEARSAFLPRLIVGSGLGASYGYPLSIEGSAPSIVNVNYSSAIYNPAQRAFARSAEVNWRASQSTAENVRQDVVLETAVTYVELDSVNSRLAVLREQVQRAANLVKVAEERVKEGIDPEIELSRARLIAARARMNFADAEGAAAVLRERLGQLTGVSSEEIEIVSSSVPSIPDASTENDLVKRALSSSPAVRAAELQARARELQAEGQQKANYPTADLAGQYGLLSRTNNFQVFFNEFQRNNATVGLAVRLPLLDYRQRAAVETAGAELLQAREQAEVTKNQVSTQTLQLARSVQQLRAAEEVAQLEYQVASSQAEALQTRIEAAAPPAPGTAPPSPRDLQLVRIQAGQFYAALLDISFQLQRARLQLLRAIGNLENWVLAKN